MYLWILFMFFILYQQSYSQIVICAKSFFEEEEKKHLKCYEKCSERFGVEAERNLLYLACFLSWDRTQSRPSLLDKCMAFSALSTSCWPESFQLFFFLRNGRSAFTGRWYNTGVTFWQGIWCRFQVAPSNYSSDYFQTAVQLRSALGWS